jgi:hypothetical protein
MTKAINPEYPTPLPQVATYLPPENIPWLSAAEPALKGDLDHLFNPQYFPLEPVPMRPVGVSTPELIRTPSPMSIPEYGTGDNPQPVSYSPPSEEVARGLEPLVIFTPGSPAVYPPASYSPLPTATPAPAPDANPNPNGSDAPQSTPTPIPEEPIDPAEIIGAPPVPPEIYDDKWKFFDFMPTVNPFSFNPFLKRKV